MDDVVEVYRVTPREQREAPFNWCADPWSILFNGPIMFGRGIEKPGPDDSWEAWSEVDGTTIVSIKRASVRRWSLRGLRPKKVSRPTMLGGS